ncbi:MAG: hypothetical protein WCA15_03930 [Candidatus Acidiferrales bacterium]
MLSSPPMDEPRKRIIYLAAIFLCRRLASLEGRPSPAREAAYRDSIETAVELMRRIDARFPQQSK